MLLIGQRKLRDKSGCGIRNTLLGSINQITGYGGSKEGGVVARLIERPIEYHARVHAGIGSNRGGIDRGIVNIHRIPRGAGAILGTCNSSIKGAGNPYTHPHWLSQ